jgi:hypothetical protein
MKYNLNKAMRQLENRCTDKPASIIKPNISLRNEQSLAKTIQPKAKMSIRQALDSNLYKGESCPNYQKYIGMNWTIAFNDLKS